jgi:hypothetical protein
MTSARRLVKAAKLGGLLFIPVVLAGLALMNPHAPGGSLAVFFSGMFLVLPYALLIDQLAAQGPWITIAVILPLQYLWVFAWTFIVVTAYEHFKAPVQSNP